MDDHIQSVSHPLTNVLKLTTKTEFNGDKHD